MDFKECINIAWKVFEELAEEEVEEEQEEKSEHEMQGQGPAKKRKHNYDYLTHGNATDRVRARITDDHMWIPVVKDSQRCVICSSGKTDRRVSFKCMQCDVHLHENCFKLFHSQPVLKKILDQDAIKKAVDDLRKQSNRNKTLKRKR
jgi:hypothetical protein